MSYLILFAALCFGMIMYMRWARKNGVIDKPNERSSHTKPTIRGGGIIFPMTILLWALLFNHSSWFFVFAVLLIGIIGFLDDKYSLHQLPRIVFQSIAVLLLLYQLIESNSNILVLVCAFILITGWLNTFNFMDGINGISVLYALSVMVGVYLFRHEVPEVSLSLIVVVFLSLLVLGWFNVRKQALVFAGDVGSLSLGLILAYFMAHLIMSSGRWEFILFLSVYGVDSVLTIIHRLIKKENIFEAHRSHLYQYLANEWGISHVIISVTYALLQLSIIVIMQLIEVSHWSLYAVSVLISLILVYVSLKAFILKSVRIT